MPGTMSACTGTARRTGALTSVSQWAAVDLDAFGAAEEIEVTVTRADGTTRRPVTVWVVRVGDDLYARSWAGQESKWIRAALRAGVGRIRAGDRERPVTFQSAAGPGQEPIDQAYRTKYGARYESAETMASPVAGESTVRLVPR
jgi:hypothetical protein